MLCVYYFLLHMGDPLAKCCLDLTSSLAISTNSINIYYIYSAQVYGCRVYAAFPLVGFISIRACFAGTPYIAEHTLPKASVHSSHCIEEFTLLTRMMIDSSRFFLSFTTNQPVSCPNLDES